MSPQPSSSRSREIVWPSVITVISAAILIGAEVFGAAFAGGWALAILFGLDDTAAHILQAVLFATRRPDHGGVHPRGPAHRAFFQASLELASSAPTRLFQAAWLVQARWIARARNRCGTGANALTLLRRILTPVHV